MSTTRPPRRTHAERSAATREQLIHAAIDVVHDKSYHGATVFEVAKSAGVTPGALQHHFGSKAVLMMRVIDEILRASGPTSIPWPPADLPLRERASAFVELLWQHAYEPPRFLVAWNVYFGCREDAELCAYIAQMRGEVTRGLHARFLSIFPEATGTPEVESFVDLVLASLRGMGMSRLFDREPGAHAPQRRLLAELIEARCTEAAAPGRARRSPRTRRSTA